MEFETNSEMTYEMWQYCDELMAVRLHERLAWQDRYGKVHVESQEPIHLLQGQVPSSLARQRAVVEAIKRRTVEAYVCQDGVLDARWELLKDGG